MRTSFAWLIALLLCVGYAAAIGVADDEQARVRQIIAGLRDREAKTANALKFSTIRSWSFRQTRDPGGGEPESTLVGYMSVRQPELARSRWAQFREATRTPPAQWDPANLDWNEISSTSDMRVSPSEALMLTQRCTEPGELEQPALTTFEPFPFDGPHRYDAPTSNPHMGYLGFIPGEISTASEFLADPSVKTHLGERARIDGVECSKVTAKAKTGSYDLWVDDANRIRKIEVYRGAFDDYYGKPIWKFTLLGEESKREEPTEGERQTYLREVHTYSDYREIAPSVSLPHQLDYSIERRDPDGEIHTSTGKATIASLSIQDGPFPESETALDVPEGTTVNRSPSDGVTREWHDGRITVVKPAEKR